jgi:hypothetical protein
MMEQQLSRRKRIKKARSHNKRGYGRYGYLDYGAFYTEQIGID